MRRPFFALTWNAHLWLPGYVRARWERRSSQHPRRVWVTFTDHFEPLWHGVDEEKARRRVKLWRQGWPEIAARCGDSTGRLPCYTFFYTEEQYRPELVELLAEMARAGIADVEVHLHHDGEGEQNFVDRVAAFTETLFVRHGLLRKRDNQVIFGFIHGDWALDNSHPEGRYCGLNNEILLLRDLGCYADFTLPSAPSPTQTRMVNTIYWAIDDPHLPKSHDVGVPVRTDGPIDGDLMLIPGPLGLRKRETAVRHLPRLETGELAAHDPPSRYRAAVWLDLAPCIRDNIFIKLFTHGAQERNAATLLGGGLKLALQYLSEECDARGCDLYFVSAWEMWLTVDALREGKDPVLALDSVRHPRSGSLNSGPFGPEARLPSRPAVPPEECRTRL